MPSSTRAHSVALFAWQNGGNGDSVVLFDQFGNSIDYPIPEEQLRIALRVFDGRPRSIRRTTGGMAAAVPNRIVFPHEAGFPLKIEIRFCDLVRNVTGEVIGEHLTMHTKSVLIEEVGAGIPLVIGGRYIVELGMGLVPVYVVQFRMCGPIHYADIRVEGHPGNEVYRIPALLLRKPAPNIKVDEWKVAIENLRWVRQMGRDPLPSLLRSPFAKPSNDNEDLLPFGVLEPLG